MKLEIFAIYDSKAVQYLTPFFMPNRGMAERAFKAAVADQTTDFHRFAEDYTLFHVGTWDGDNAGLEEKAPPVGLAHAHEIKAQLNQLDMFNTEPANLATATRDTVDGLRKALKARPSRIQGGE